MKKSLHFLASLALFMTLITSCYDDSPLKEEIDSLKLKVASLEQLTSQMNTNTSALQTAVTALQNNDYVTSIAEIKEEEKVIGYTLTFAKSGNITIYHGKNGTNGINGKDGVDGLNGDSFFHDVTQDNDNVYLILANETVITFSKQKQL